MPKVLTGWTCVCVAAWLILGGIWEIQEADCRADDGWFCFAPGAALLVVGVVGALVCIVGLCLIAIAWMLVEVGRHRRSQRRSS